jgi:thiamine-monophosphate kinase
MSNTEFDIIKTYFSFPSKRSDIDVVNGDDCAVMSVPPDKQLVVTVDTLIEGVHFPQQTSARDIAYKALMVNLSDLSAMGAAPAWVTLAITLPDINHDWLAGFSQQLESLLAKYNIGLVGGDTTHGELSITLQAMGLADRTRIMLRSGAKAGDNIYVTGFPGSAAIGLSAVMHGYRDAELSSCIQSLNRPLPPIAFAQSLTGFCRCAIDISDGLLADLGHITRASKTGAVLYLDKLPLSEAMTYYFHQYNHGEVDWLMLSTRGDDYQLCFTADPVYDAEIRQLAERFSIELSCIGNIVSGSGIDCYVAGEPVLFEAAGYRHF